MTDDITRGLDLLADEAAPAIIDTQHVISRARMRTRGRRAITASALATVALVSALVLTLGNPAPTSEQGTTPPPGKTVEGWLNRLLTEALPDVIPSNWSLLPASPTEEQGPQLEFQCYDSNANGCGAHANYNDGVGDIDLQISVNRIPRNFDDLCDVQYCPQWEPPVRQTLRDGTRTQVLTYTEKPTSRDIEELLATRPDGTQIKVAVIWPQGQRSEPALARNEILQFATVFSYDAALPVGDPLNKPPETTEVATEEDPNREGRVNEELTEALDEVVPAEWSKASNEEQPVQPPFAFDCKESSFGPGTAPEIEREEDVELVGETCWTAVYYRDATGIIGIKFSISSVKVFDVPCETGCAEKTLSDGTKTQMASQSAPFPTQTMGATRPDGTHIWVEVYWQEQRTEMPLTDDELLKFATAFTF